LLLISITNVSAFGAKSAEKTIKYSSNFIEKPTGSLSLINPEKTNSNPVNTLMILVNNFM
jgi:hypothetical protein